MNTYLTKKWDINLFKDNEHNVEFINNGFYTIPLLNDVEIEDIKNKLIEANIPDIAFFHSHGYLNYALKKKIDILIKQFLTAKINTLLNKKYSLFTGVYILKNPSPKTDMFLHADDSLCEEKNYMPFNIWIPLIDVDIENGTMCLIPGSHQKTCIYRGRTTKDTYIAKNKKLFFKDFLPVIMPKGNALIYHPGCVHFSPPNRSKNPRPVIAAACLPEEATPFLSFEKRSFLSTKSIIKYPIDIEIFYNWNNKDEPKIIPSEIIQLKEK